MGMLMCTFACVFRSVQIRCTCDLLIWLQTALLRRLRKWLLLLGDARAPASLSTVITRSIISAGCPQAIVLVLRNATDANWLFRHQPAVYHALCVLDNILINAP